MNRQHGPRRLRAAFAGVVGLALATTPSPVDLSAQTPIEVTGVVLDAETRAGIPDVVLRVEGTDVSAASDDGGRFVLRGLEPGEWVLHVRHLAYGDHEHALTLGPDVTVRLEVRLAAQAIELAPLLVEAETVLDRERRTTGVSFREITREEIQRSIGTSRHLGDLIARSVPGMHLRQSNQFSGFDVCLEFRSAASISIVNRRPCNHPAVVVDGVRISNPQYLYGQIGLANLHRIQVIPPSEAGTRFGTGSLYGVVLIETERPGHVGAAGASPAEYYAPAAPRLTFDWDQDPQGHRTSWSLVGAAVGNALGLVAGVAIARQCIEVINQEIEASCGTSTTLAAGTAAVVLPALGSAVGARVGGASDLSVGRMLPATVGAGIMLFPGYVFSLSTVGGGREAVNVVGRSLLIVGVPLAVTLADRLFRRLR